MKVDEGHYQLTHIFEEILRVTDGTKIPSWSGLAIFAVVTNSSVAGCQQQSLI